MTGFFSALGGPEFCDVMLPAFLSGLQEHPVIANEARIKTARVGVDLFNALVIFIQTSLQKQIMNSKIHIATAHGHTIFH
jgi:hypothetical protein